jgi:23S rRNA pseudouridine1911/1915/1917 synthase
MTNKWNIGPEEAGQRLDVFLASKMPDLTRSAIAKKIKEGAGLVNGKKTTVHKFLKAGDKVEFNGAPTQRAPSIHLRNQSIEETPRRFDLNEIIIKETPDWIVVNKPAGLLVHPDSQHPRGTLIDLLIAHFPPLAKIGEDPERPGIVHRLDKDVSGLMVVAKTQDAFDNLKQQFSHHQTKKVYLAMVEGAPPKEEGDIKFRIARSGTQARMAARPITDQRGKAAWSHYKVIQKMRRHSLLKVEILSGRTHQIRAHLFALGCPVVGDDLYKNKKTKYLRNETDAGRIMLQSIELTFDDPKTNERMTFILPPDQSFDTYLPEKKI